MANVAAPASGPVTFSPLHLGAVHSNLVALKAKAEPVGGLTPAQVYFFLQLYVSWQYYRPSQNRNFRGVMDGLVFDLCSLPVVTK